ncbi:MAG: hypothetical protein JWL85_763 [Candidatus Saccharibacteria bacterium]|nr:hypothetical protein [Candidatus Saccharibacteria bacterium]
MSNADQPNPYDASTDSELITGTSEALRHDLESNPGFESGVWEGIVRIDTVFAQALLKVAEDIRRQGMSPDKAFMLGAKFSAAWPDRQAQVHKVETLLAINEIAEEQTSFPLTITE